MPAVDIRRERLTQLLLTGGLLVASMIIGLAGQAVVAALFGTGSRSDSLFIARDIADLAGKALLTSQAVGVLVPFVVALRLHEPAGVAERALSAAITTVAIAGLLLAVLVFAVAEPLFDVLAPGFDAETAERGVGLLRILAPMLPFVAVGALATAALQAGGRFGRAMAPANAGAATVLIALPPMVHVWGIEGAAGAMTIGAVVQGALAWALIVAHGMPPLVAPWRERAHVAEFIRRLRPLVPYAVVAQASGAVLRVAASLLSAGLYTAFSLAYRLYRALLTLLLMPVQQVLLPALSHSAASGRSREFAAELTSTLRYVTVLLAPATLGLAALSEPVVSVVFERGAFDAASTHNTARVLALFALAVLPTGAYILLEQAAYALRRTRTVVRVNVALELTQALLFLPLVLLLGAEGIPVTVLVATVAASVGYLLALRPSPPVAHLRFALGVATALLAMVAAIAAVAAAVDALLDPGPGVAQLVIVAPSCVAGVAAYLTAAHAVGVREPFELVRLLRGLGRRDAA